MACHSLSSFHSVPPSRHVTFLLHTLFSFILFHSVGLVRRFEDRRGRRPLSTNMYRVVSCLERRVQAHCRGVILVWERRQLFRGDAPPAGPKLDPPGLTAIRLESESIPSLKCAMQSDMPTCGVHFFHTVSDWTGLCDITCGLDEQSGEQCDTSPSHHMRANWWQLHRLERLCRVTR